MISNIDPAGQMLMAQLDRIAARLDKAQRQISSGLRIAAASDAPDEVAEMLTLRAEFARTDQIRTNLERAKSETQAADAALERAVEVLDSAAALAVQGAGTLAAGQRGHLAEQVRGLQQEIVALSRTSYGGRYLFSGDQDQTPPYELNIAAPEGVDPLTASGATRQLEHPSGLRFVIAKHAADIFDDRNTDGTPSQENVFAAIQSLASALESDDAAAVGQALGKVRAASSHVNVQLSFYGSVENRIASAIDDGGKLATRLKAALSAHEDADLPASIMELQQVQVNRSAALQARAAVERNSLFDYLK